MWVPVCEKQKDKEEKIIELTKNTLALGFATFEAIEMTRSV